MHKLQLAAAMYVGIGIVLSVQAAPLSWRFPPGNLPFWFFLWPWPVSAHLVYKATGKYPDWTPEV